MPEAEDVIAAREGFIVVRKHADVADIVARGQTR
jgi:hypothetical protein